ncbi:MAG: SUMF1/EgtB/PvdO family nonheme iron enzyme [Myxococcota bacterium]
MRPSPGDLICGQVQIDEEADPDVGGHVFGATLHAALTEETKATNVWLTIVERELVPSQVDVSRFMAGAAELLSLQHPALVPVRLVDREADFCVVGYQVLPSAVSVQRRLEGSGSTAGLVARVAVEVARGLAYLHKHNRTHGALAPGNIMLWEKGVALWQYAVADACSQQALQPRFRALGGDVVAPEVRQGNPPTAAADIYAWGAVVAALATDCLGSAALAAVEDGELDAGPLTPIIKASLAFEAGERPATGLELLKLIQAGPAEGDGLGDHSGMARHAELRELAGRYVDEIEGRVREPEPRKKRRGKRPRVFKRVAKEAYPPELAPIAGVMEAPDEPVPDPFSLPPGEVAPAEVRQEQEPAAPIPAPPPMQITARRIEDEPSRRFQPDALTPPDGARLNELAPPPAAAAPEPSPPQAPSAPPAGAGVVLPPLTTMPGTEYELPAPPKRSSPIDLPPAPDTRVKPQRPSGRPPAEAAPIPPPPAHDDMAAGDSGFGLALPVVEGIDERLQEADPLADVVGALAAAESSPHLSTVDGDDAEVNPAAVADDGPRLELDTSPKPAASSARKKEVPSTPAGPPPVSKVGPLPDGPPSSFGGLELDTSRVKPARRPTMEDSDTGPRPAVAPRARPQPSPVDGKSRGPRGSTMAAVIGFGATVLAIGLTVPVAQERGGLSALLGLESSTAAAPQTPTEPVEAAEPVETPVVAAAPPTCPPDTVRLKVRKGADVCMESGEYPGLREIPKTQVTLADAKKACEDGGRRLCSASEWKLACRGAEGRRQPYAGARVEGRCNDALDGVGQNLSRSGARAECVSPEGVYDLVGNVGEWVDGGAVLGGDAMTNRASCTTRKKPGASTMSPAIGFRCCVSLDEGDEPAPAKSKPRRSK